MTRVQRSIVSAAAVLAAGAATARAGFTYQTLDVPFGTETELFDVNDAGTVAGSYLDANGVRTGFTRTAAGAYSTYEVPGATGTRIFGINASGQTVGEYQVTNGDQHAFVRAADGTLTTIDPPGQTYNYAFRINDQGQIGGYYFEFNDVPPDYLHITSFLRQPGGTFQTLLASPTGDGTVLRGINNAGVQSGWYFGDDGFIHGLLHEATTGAFTTYDAPNGLYTLFDQVNDGGTAVGNTLDQHTADFDSTPFLRTAGGTFVPFATPGGGDGNFYSVNNAGLIVGAYADAGDDLHGLIATYSAVPEPATAAAAAALATTGLLGRRRRGRRQA